MAENDWFDNEEDWFDREDITDDHERILASGIKIETWVTPEGKREYAVRLKDK